jgi:cyclase
MLMRRVIACLDVRGGEVVKGVEFAGLRSAGDPVALARRHAEAGIDEIVVLDIAATVDDGRTRLDVIRRTSASLFIPLTAGGGIRTEDDACAVIEAGADKVSLNTAAIDQPGLISDVARRYGSQAVVVAIDARRVGDRTVVFSRGGRVATGMDAAAWAREAERRGAGEILLTSIDRDGSRDGFDCELTATVSAAVGIPVIASGGAGRPSHFTDVFTRGRADAALAASIFHFGDVPVAALKQHLAASGIPVRVSC